MNTVTKLDTIVHTTLSALHDHSFGLRLHAGCVTQDEYAAFLVQTYHYVVHTRPLLRRSGERLMSEGKTLQAQLFFGKADEENGHEQWILDDLQAIGEDPERIHREKPVAAVLTFVTWNSFVVEHGSPIALLGAAYVLEALSAARAGIVAKNLIENSGIRGIKRGVRFLNGHADADVDHCAALGQTIENIVASLADHDDIVTTAKITQSTYTALYSSLAQRPKANPALLGVIHGP
jgi:pyrroloquinoline quinone (PQQ) biosynthesis protein C